MGGDGEAMGLVTHVLQQVERRRVRLEAALLGAVRAADDEGEDGDAAGRRRSHEAQRGAFGGYPDNGLSVFYEKRLRP